MTKYSNVSINIPLQIFFAEVRGILNIRSCASLEYSKKNMSVKGQYLCPISMCPPNTAISL